ncbi:MAG: phosphoribosylaminoimidazolesuccinocarboxamide synthase [Bdellovibrionales bacterium]|nr:phosphoribosylaminoimidazolesuccinocarboxamide synthase [Bdellovibrionales bacterium]
MEITESFLLESLPNVVATTDFGFLGERYEGKVRDSYIKDDIRYLITTDRLSCFDVVVTTVPFKGQTLNQMAVEWFKLAGDIIENHLVDVPDPNVMVVKNCEILPIEVVIRGYLTGSAWRDYQDGKAISGVTLPPGLKASQRFETPLLTPSTKAAKGDHDEPISEKEIISQQIVPAKLWEQVRETAFALFKLGQERAREQGLLLVDTKYEFGLYKGKLVLADEIHTMDSSRYWISQGYEEAFAAGNAPKMLDKEPTRQWLLSQGYKGEGKIPEFTDKHRIEISQHYIKSFELITGSKFKPEGPKVKQRIEQNMRAYVS